MSSVSLHPMREFDPDVDVGARWRIWLLDCSLDHLALLIVHVNAPLSSTRLAQWFEISLLNYQTQVKLMISKQAKKTLHSIFNHRKTSGMMFMFFVELFSKKMKLDQYHTYFRTLAEPSEFTSLDFELEEQIIIGGTSTRISKQALRDPSYDLQPMLLDDRRDEISKFQSAKLEGKEQMSRLSTKPNNCQYCGGPTPHLNTCPATGRLSVKLSWLFCQ